MDVTTHGSYRWVVRQPNGYPILRMAMQRISAAPQERRDFAARTLGMICEALNTQGNVNFFLEREADLDKVLQIFIRINSGGTKLSYSDLLLSIATASWKGTDARQAIHGFVDELNSVNDELTFDQDFVLKSALVLSDISDVKFKVENFNAQNMGTIERAWPSIKVALSLAPTGTFFWPHGPFPIIGKRSYSHGLLSAKEGRDRILSKLLIRLG
jgi:hypothetical protein